MGQFHRTASSLVVACVHSILWLIYPLICTMQAALGSHYRSPIRVTGPLQDPPLSLSLLSLCKGFSQHRHHYGGFCFRHAKGWSQGICCCEMCKKPMQIFRYVLPTIQFCPCKSLICVFCWTVNLSHVFSNATGTSFAVKAYPRCSTSSSFSMYWFYFT